MHHALIVALVFMVIVAIVLFYNVRWHSNDAKHWNALFNNASYQLGKVHDALADVPHDATTELGTVILRYKAQCLKERNELWEAQNLLDQCEPRHKDEKLIDRLARVLTQKGNAENELQYIDRFLEGRAALETKSTRIEKIAFSLEMNAKAARGEKVSNRDEDYR